MKNFVRCILMGVCVSLGYGLARASTQVSVDTLAFCFAPGESVKGNIIAPAFYDFLKKDSLMILGKGTDTVSYKVAYKDFQIEFTGNGVTGGTGPLNNIHSDQTIGTATGDLKKQYIQCTVSYTRNIHFDFNENYLDDRSENILHSTELLGIEGTPPDFNLNSRRKWHTVLCIEKSLSTNGTFAIEARVGDTCLDKSVRLRVPDRYADMKCRWACDRNVAMLNSSKTHEVTVFRRNVPFLTTLVTCTLSGCNDKTVSSSIRLRTAYTPASELTFDDCLPTASKSITVTASNPVPGVHYEWVGLSDIRELPSVLGSETIRYPVSGSDNFTIRLKTTGGCLPSWKDTIVHRKLGSDVKLVVLDSCLAAGIPFHMATDPQLPNMDLAWSAPAGCHIIGSVGSDARKDMVTVIKNASMIGQSALITVSDKVCHDSIQDYVSISESYTEMEVKTEQGMVLHDGDMVCPGTKIIFTAPQHSSITNYLWMKRVVPGSQIQYWQGPAEITVEAPAKNTSLSVTVAYVSCFGRQSHTYTFEVPECFELFE